MIKIIMLLCGSVTLLASDGESLANTLLNDTSSSLASKKIRVLTPRPFTVGSFGNYNRIADIPISERHAPVKMVKRTPLPSLSEESNSSGQYNKIVAGSLVNDLLSDTSKKSDVSNASTLPNLPSLSQSCEIIGDCPPPTPLRRSTRELSPDTIDWVINNHTLKWRLITMVRYIGTNGITEEQVINLIKANPGESNPYSDSHKAFLVTLASREDSKINIVSAILDSNQDALNCISSDCTPLDEAMDFSQGKVAKFLREKGGLMHQDIIKNILKGSNLDDKLITMIGYLGKYGITEEQVIDLIKSNPDKSNPYSNSHGAHLIGLACRSGKVNIVSAILDNNQDALNCDNSGLTPLDEAIYSGYREVEQLLRARRGVTKAELTVFESAIIQVKKQEDGKE